jgi:SAM-dependent methyltransferase
VLSGTALGYEILLTRLFSIIHWHHFASMVISLALLGYGASGTFLTLAERWLAGRFTAAFVASSLAFSASCVGCFLLAQRLPLNPLELPWDARQPGYLLGMYLLLVIPFFAVANGIGLALWQFRSRVHRVYAMDLLGAGAGAAGIIALLTQVRPERALALCAGLGVLSAGLAVTRRRRLVRPAALLGGALVAALPAGWIQLGIADYKGLSQSLAVMGAQREVELSGPLGLVTLVRNEMVPFRFAPGMSLATGQAPPEQLGLFVDAEPIGAVTRFDGENPPAYLDALTSALPYHLLDRPRVLLLGAGGGSGVLQALLHRASRVDAVELNPQVVELVRDDYAAFAGDLYARGDVRAHIAEARGYLASTPERYDLIQIDLLDAFGTSSAGLRAQSESYLYTVEALESCLRHLTPGGMLAITRWLRLPPRDSLKLTTTAVRALQGTRAAEPARHLALIRGWKTTTLLVGRAPLGPAAIESLRRFTRERSFDTAWYPGMPEGEANRYNRLDKPVLYRGVQALLGPDAASYVERYKLDIAPATDDRPYFFSFSKWSSLPELLDMPSRAGLSQLDWGYWVLVATLIQAVVASAVLILVPLLALRGSRRAPAPLKWRTLLYFGAIGLAFMFLEIAFIQRFTLFLAHPLYAVSVVLAGFLVFAGLGSALSGRLAGRRGGLWAVAGGIAALSLALLAGLAQLFEWLQPFGEPGRIAGSLAVIAPLACLMGIPFPMGVARLGRAGGRDLIPWAWGINGCASVISAVLAGLLAMEIGFSGLVIAAVGFYLLAAATLPGRGRLVDSTK